MSWLGRKSKDLRRKRQRKPGIFLVSLVVIATINCSFIPFVGWICAALAWIDLIGRFRQAKYDSQWPYGTFYGEN